MANQKSLNKKKTKELEWDRFVKENHTNFSKDANGIKYEFYEDDLLEFITRQRTELLEEIKNHTFIIPQGHITRAFKLDDKDLSFLKNINLLNK